MKKSDDRYRQAKRITLLGALINALLGIIKIVGGYIYSSHALTADGIHSFSDLLTDIMVLLASKYGSQDADDAHPYGHQRIETAATLLLALLLILAGAGIGWDAVAELIKDQQIKPEWWALPIALASITANEILFHYTRYVGLCIQSALITANAWHHRSDAASSIVVALGLLGSLLGFIYFDALAAIIVSLMIVKMGVTYGWDSVKELIDTGVEPILLQEIEQHIQSVEGVKKIHQLRSRLMGGDIFIDVHVLVSTNISVSEGHYIAQKVHRHLLSQLPRVKDVTVHVDPEDDEITCPSYHLPSRKQLENQLLQPWQQLFPAISHWILHYLDGQLIIDLFHQPQSGLGTSLKKMIQTDLELMAMIKEVRLYRCEEVIMRD